MESENAVDETQEVKEKDGEIDNSDEDEEDSEAFPCVVVVGFGVAFFPVMSYCDAIGYVRSATIKRLEAPETHKIETGSSIVSGRFKNRRTGACMNAVSSGRARAIG